MAYDILENTVEMGRHKKDIAKFYDDKAPERMKWIEKNSYYYAEHHGYMKFLIPKGSRILEVGCGAGNLLNELQPSFGVGVEISERMVELGQISYPHIRFIVGDIETKETRDQIEGKFDYIIITDAVGYLQDCQSTFYKLRNYCDKDTRIIISYYSWLWEPILKFAEMMHMKMSHPTMNWLSTDTITNLLELSDYNVIKKEWRQLVPKKIFGLGSIINKYIGTLPLIRRLCLRNYVVARPIFKNCDQKYKPSVSIIIPCRNEAGNIEPAIKRIPDFAEDIEIIYVEGNSIDETKEEILRVKDTYKDKNIKLMQQDGVGKWDAVSKAFDNANNDLLMILDADLTVCPEELPKFYQAIQSGKGEFINGTRMVYPMEVDAMRFLNYWANSIFSYLFTWILNQKYTDTLCGTKVIFKKDYQTLKERCNEYAEIDPFGDFFLIFGAQKVNLHTIEIPIRYAARSYGETQISRFKHGLILAKMVIYAYRRFKVL